MFPYRKHIHMHKPKTQSSRCIERHSNRIVREKKWNNALKMVTHCITILCYFFSSMAGGFVLVHQYILAKKFSLFLTLVIQSFTRHIESFIINRIRVPVLCLLCFFFLSLCNRLIYIYLYSMTESSKNNKIIDVISVLPDSHLMSIQMANKTEYIHHHFLDIRTW